MREMIKRGVSRYIVDISASSVKNQKMKLPSGVELHLPTDYEDKFLAVPQEGTIVATTAHNKRGLNVGDVVVYNYLIATQKVDKDHLFIEEFVEDAPKRNAVYCKRVGNGFEMSQDYVIVEQVGKSIETSIPGFVLPDSLKEDIKVATVKYSSEDSNIPKGAKIAVFNNNFVNVKLHDQTIIIVDAEASVPFYWDENNDLVLMDQWAMIKPEVENKGWEDSSTGVIMPFKVHESKLLGEIVKLPESYEGPMEVGQGCFFERKEYYMIEIDGDEYYFSNFGRYEHINLIFPKLNGKTLYQSLATQINSAVSEADELADCR